MERAAGAQRGWRSLSRACFFLPDDVHTTMKISSASATKASSPKMSIGYWSRKSDMAVSIKNGHCMWFGARAA
ncbi:murein transglycosylase, partial [Burkholderia vietnamiensis]